MYCNIQSAYSKVLVSRVHEGKCLALIMYSIAVQTAACYTDGCTVGMCVVDSFCWLTHHSTVEVGKTVNTKYSVLWHLDIITGAPFDGT